MITKKNLEIGLFIFFAVLSLFLTSPHLTSQYFYRPKDHVFIGLSGYYEDFYYYLDQFNQGREGRLINENRFTIERFPPTFLYFNHLLFGRLGGMIGLAGYESYSLFGLLFKLLFILFSYPVIWLFFRRNAFHRICTYLIFLYSSSLPSITFQNGIPSIEPATALFRTSNRVLTRFGTSPNGMLVNFLFIVFLFIFLKLMHEGYSSKRKTLLLIVFLAPLFLLLAIGDMIAGIFLLLIGVIILLVNRKLFAISSAVQLKSLLLVFLVITGVVFVYMIRIVNHDPVYSAANNWDVNQYLQQIKAVGIIGMLRGFGLQWPLGLFGVFLLLRKKHVSVYEAIAATIVLTSFIGYYFPLLLQLPVPGFRFIFPAVYIFLAVFVMTALIRISSLMQRKHTLMILITVYMTINLTSFLRVWVDEFQPLKEPLFHFAYIPKELYQGFVFLRNAEPKDGNVLASPYTSIDLMIPGLTGKHSYTGHFLTTYNVSEKDENANNLFFVWSDTPQTHEFLQKNNIRFMVVTKYSRSVDLFKTYYPFLKVAFENPMVTIFRYDF